MKNAASAPMTRCGRAATMDQERRNAPDTDTADVPPPRLGMLKTIAAARTKVMASATKSMLGVDFGGERAKIAPATPNPMAPASIEVAATMALALPTCPAGTRLGIAAWRAGWTIAL